MARARDHCPATDYGAGAHSRRSGTYGEERDQARTAAYSAAIAGIKDEAPEVPLLAGPQEQHAHRGSRETAFCPYGTGCYSGTGEAEIETEEPA